MINTEYFIASKLSKAKGEKFSRFIIKLAIIATSLSLAVMIIATATITGFQKEIGEKVFGFFGHIHIMGFDYNYSQSLENEPINKNQNFYPSIDTFPEIKHIQVYATKPGIIKVNDQIEGIVLKGISDDFDWNFFQQSLTEGKIFSIDSTSTSDDILISKYTAQRLRLKVKDEVLIYFIQQPPRVRKLTVSGVYNTGLEEYDKIYALIDIKHIQKLNNWDQNQIGGFEIFTSDVNDLDKMVDFVYNNILDLSLNARTIKDINPNIFDWLALQNINQRVILILMTVVAAINLITVLLILILERTNMIGILKALGASDCLIRKIFIYNAVYIILKGLFWGNLIGIGLCFAQKYLELISLPEESYYLSYVPIDINWVAILIINLSAIIINALILLIPSYLIVKVNPIKAIRFS